MPMRAQGRKRCGLYVRVSTQEQSTKVQEAELKEYAGRRGWTVHKVYKDQGVSGGKEKRPALDELMRDCKRRRVDLVLVWKFDRFARSLSHLVRALDEFRGLGIDFVSFTEAIDTGCAGGELVFHIFGAVAQFERSLIAERTRAGLAHARKMGKRLGRPPESPLSEVQIAQLQRERKQGGTSLRKLGDKYGISLWRAYSLCGAHASVCKRTV